MTLPYIQVDHADGDFLTLPTNRNEKPSNKRRTRSFSNNGDPQRKELPSERYYDSMNDMILSRLRSKTWDDSRSVEGLETHDAKPPDWLSLLSSPKPRRRSNTGRELLSPVLPISPSPSNSIWKSRSLTDVSTVGYNRQLKDSDVIDKVRKSNTSRNANTSRNSNRPNNSQNPVKMNKKVDKKSYVNSWCSESSPVERSNNKISPDTFDERDEEKQLPNLFPGSAEFQKVMNDMKHKKMSHLMPYTA